MKKPIASRYKGEGMNAFEDGMEIWDCPYMDGEEEREWVEGWEAMKEQYDFFEANNPIKILTSRIEQLKEDSELIDVLKNIVNLIEK